MIMKYLDEGFLIIICDDILFQLGSVELIVGKCEIVKEIGEFFV